MLPARTSAPLPYSEQTTHQLQVQVPVLENLKDQTDLLIQNSPPGEASPNALLGCSTDSLCPIEPAKRLRDFATLPRLGASTLSDLMANSTTWVPRFSLHFARQTLLTVALKSMRTALMW